MCDTVDHGHAHVCMSVCAFTKVPESVRMTREPSPAFSAETLEFLDLILGSRVGGVPCRGSGVPCLPRIGVYRACHGSGCAVPAVPFTTGPDTRRVVKNRVDSSTTSIPSMKDRKMLFYVELRVSPRSSSCQLLCE